MSSATVEQNARSVAAQPAPQDLYRLLLLRKGGSELLVANERPPFTLPCVEIPKWERVAENLTEAVRKRYGISAICLFTPELSDTKASGEPPMYQVMETKDARTAVPNVMCWLPLESISNQRFAVEQDLVAIADTLCQIAGFQSNEATAPFGRPGWIEELFSWAQREIEPYGLHLTGTIRQLNASPAFSLIRLETNAQAVWFKAVGEPNLREFSISIALARLFPGFVPTIIANHPSWQGWLTTEFQGSTLDEVPDACAWIRTARTLAELQIGSVGKTEQLLEAGCRDLRIARLLTLVDPFIEMMSQLMHQQEKIPPAVLGANELQALGTNIKEALLAWAQLNIPDTLGHLDFNPGDILCSADQCVFLDWAEAYVGPPFPTFQFLIEHARQEYTRNSVCERQLITRYNIPWVLVAPPDRVAKAHALTPLTAAFLYAVALDAWQDPTCVQTPRLAGFFRSMTRRMQREAEAINANRSGPVRPQCNSAA